MTENPSSPFATVLCRIPAVPVHAHGTTPQSIVGTSTRSPPISLSRRRPCRKANNPPLLQPLSPASADRDPSSRLEYLRKDDDSQLASIWPPNRDQNSS